MKQLTQPYRIHAGTLATLDPYDQAIINEWINKGLWMLIPIKKTKQSTLNREKPAGMAVPALAETTCRTNDDDTARGRNVYPDLCTQGI